MNEAKDISLLLVEDDASLRRFIADELSECGYKVLSVGSIKEAAHEVRSKLPDIIVSDLRLPDGRGDSLLDIARELPLPPPVILITAFGQVDDAVDALRKGAADFLTKPLDIDHLILRLERTREVQHLRAMAAKALEEKAGAARRATVPMVAGGSPAWRQIEKQIPMIARTDDPVLITGPSGSGKEVVARSLHNQSRRSAQPFIPVNCSGLPANLLESELFGHQAGAFTGADKRRKGLFAAAEGGTLFLDEIGDMPLEMQTKLLRTLQEMTIRPLGSDHEEHVDVRILAATNRNIEEEIQLGGFREDLFYRLETFHLKLPPLRERPEDIELFTRSFIAEVADELDIDAPNISEAAMALLTSYAFPGNVRELKNIVRRAVTFATGAEIQPQDLPGKLRSGMASTGPWASLAGNFVPLDTIRREYAKHVLEACSNNKQEAARILGISRHTLYSLIDPAES